MFKCHPKSVKLNQSVKKLKNFFFTLTLREMGDSDMGPCEGVQEKNANGADGNSVYEHIIMLRTMYY